MKDDMFLILFFYGETSRTVFNVPYTKNSTYKRRQPTPHKQQKLQTSKSQFLNWKKSKEYHKQLKDTQHQIKVS